MFNNAGKKLKVIAVIFFILGALASLISAIVFWAANSPRNSTVGLGFLTLIGGSFVSWLISLAAITIGETHENVENLACRVDEIYSKLDKLGKALPVEENSNTAASGKGQPNLSAVSSAINSKLECPECGYRNSIYSSNCASCGKPIDKTIARIVRLETYAAKTTAPTKPSDKIACPHCGAWNKKTNETCFACGEKMSKQDE